MGRGLVGVVTVLGKFKGRCWVLAFAQMKSQESMIKKTNQNLLCFQYFEPLTLKYSSLHPLEPIKLLDTNRYLRNRQCMTESE